jgi:hypothetical protein
MKQIRLRQNGHEKTASRTRVWASKQKVPLFFADEILAETPVRRYDGGIIGGLCWRLSREEKIVWK